MVAAGVSCVVRPPSALFWALPAALELVRQPGRQRLRLALEGLAVAAACLGSAAVLDRLLYGRQASRRARGSLLLQPATPSRAHRHAALRTINAAAGCLCRSILCASTCSPGRPHSTARTPGTGMLVKAFQRSRRACCPSCCSAPCSHAGEAQLRGAHLCTKGVGTRRREPRAAGNSESTSGWRSGRSVCTACPRTRSLDSCCPPFNCSCPTPGLALHAWLGSPRMPGDATGAGSRGLWHFALLPSSAWPGTFAACTIGGWMCGAGGQHAILCVCHPWLSLPCADHAEACWTSWRLCASALRATQAHQSCSSPLATPRPSTRTSTRRFACASWIARRWRTPLAQLR